MKKTRFLVGADFRPREVGGTPTLPVSMRLAGSLVPHVIPQTVPLVLQFLEQSLATC